MICSLLRYQFLTESTTKRPPFPGWDQVDKLGRVRLESGSDINRYLLL